MLALWSLAVSFAALGVLRLEFATTPASFLDRVSEGWSFYQQSLDRFGGDEIVVLAWDAPAPFDPGALEQVVALSDRLESLPGVRRVDSIATTPVVRGRADGALDLSPALPDAETPPERVRAALAGDRLAPASLVSEDGRSFAVNVVLEADGRDEDQVEVVAAAYEAVRERRGFVSGVPVYEDRAGRTTREEILTFVPVTLLLMAGLLAWIFRAGVALAVPVVASGVGVFVLLGAMGAAGEPITMTGMLLPSVLLALGTAYGMHVLVAARGVAREDLPAALAPVVPPILLSGLTTAVGFFAITTIRIDAIRALGGFGGIGVLVVLTASLTLAPALLGLTTLPARGDAPDRLFRDRVAPALVAWLVRFRTPVILVWAGLLAVSAYGVSVIHVETDAVRWWPPGSEMRNHYDAIRDRLSGISPMNVVVEAQEGRRVIEPDVLAAIDALGRHLADHPDVGKVLSIADPLRQLHGGFIDDPSQPLPEGEDLVSQYLLLLESVEHVQDAISTDRTAANVLLRTNDNGSRVLLEIAEDAEAWWRENGPSDVTARTTGIMFEFARAEEAIAWGQIRGLTLALVAIGGILLLIFRSPLVSGIALVPNIASLGILYGIMGVFGVPLDAGTVCMGTLALGIAVDDTIHVVDGYRRNRALGVGTREALVRTYRHVLPALVYTTVAVSAGFAVLALSEFLLTRNLGWVTALVVVVCLLADTTLLPAVLLGRDDEAERLEG